MSFFNKNKKIKNLYIIIITSFLIIGAYILMVNTKKSSNMYNMSNINSDNKYGKLPVDMDKTFNHDYKQFLSNNDIISSEIKKLEKDVSL
jgi:hypothetical protein